MTASFKSDQQASGWEWFIYRCSGISIQRWLHPIMACFDQWNTFSRAVNSNSFMKLMEQSRVCRFQGIAILFPANTESGRTMSKSRGLWWLHCCEIGDAKSPDCLNVIFFSKQIYSAYFKKDKNFWKKGEICYFKKGMKIK